MSIALRGKKWIDIYILCSKTSVQLANKGTGCMCMKQYIPDHK